MGKTSQRPTLRARTQTGKPPIYLAAQNNGPIDRKKEKLDLPGQVTPDKCGVVVLLPFLVPVEEDTPNNIAKNVLRNISSLLQVEALDAAGLYGALQKGITDLKNAGLLVPSTPSSAKPLPEKAPAFWRNDRQEGETPATFIQTHYSEWLGRGLGRADIRTLDLELYTALGNWLRSNKLPDGMELPTRKERTDRLAAELQAGFSTSDGTDGLVTAQRVTLALKSRESHSRRRDR